MFVAEANMLYLEAPIGVGFSYSTDPSSYESVNDRITGTTFGWDGEEFAHKTALFQKVYRSSSQTHFLNFSSIGCKTLFLGFKKESFRMGAPVYSFLSLFFPF